MSINLDFIYIYNRWDVFFYINKCVILATFLLLLCDKQFVITQYPILKLFLEAKPFENYYRYNAFIKIDFRSMT